MKITPIVLSAVWSVTSLLPADSVQQSDLDRLQATGTCAQHVRKVGPGLVKWQRSEVAKATKESSESSGIEWSFSGHYNGELKRRLVEMKFTLPSTESKSEKPLSIVSWIYDALEGQFIGRIFSLRDYKDPKAPFITTCDIFNEPKEETECRSLMQR